MKTEAILAFMLYILVNAFTPGPGNILALNTMNNYGWKKGRKLFYGIFAGYFIVQAICAVIVFEMASVVPAVIGVMKYIGAAYILYLAVGIVMSKPIPDAERQEASWWCGFILQFGNIKIFLFGITALTGYITPHFQSLPMLLLFEFIIAATGTVATLTWILFGRIFQAAYRRHFRVINVILAFLLMQCVYGLLTI